MKYGKREHGGASLTLRKPFGLPPHMRGPIVELHDLYTAPRSRGEGHAAALMTQTTVEADMAGVMLFLQVLPGDQTDRERLVRFYGRHGFAAVQAEPLLLIRPHVGMIGARGAGSYGME